MTPPAEDLYAFLGLPATAVPEAIQEALARTEKRLSGKHGLTLTELSKRRALLLQAKRWLVPADRKEEYDRSRASAAKPVANEPGEKESIEKPSPQPRPAAKPVPATAPASATSVLSPPAPPAMAPVAEADDFEDEGAGSWLSLPVLIATLAAAVVLAFAVSFALLWALSGPKQPLANADGNEPPTVVEAPDAAVEPEPETGATDAEAAPSVIRADLNDQVVLTPSNAKLIGPTIRLDGAENPPRIENWTSSDSVEWEFESPEIAIYQATLEYGMKPECEGNRFAVKVGSSSLNRTVGSGSYANGIYRDVFFLKIEKRGLITLKIEPRDVVGGELMQFRNLTLAPRQKQAAP
jgi:hypothetical protein